MAENPNAGYYQSGKGSLTGFDQVNLPTGNPDLRTVGWSIESVRNFLLNQSGANFPDPSSLTIIEDRIRDHLADLDNPHQVTLDQIVGNFTREVLGSIIHGTVPDHPPFFAYSATLPLPLGTIVPVVYTNSNVYRKTAGGWLVDASQESDFFGTDYSSGKAGTPLFSSLVNITPSTWATDSATLHNTTLLASENTTLNYPFSFYDVRETPMTTTFGVDIPMTQDLQVLYTTNFFIMAAAVGGSVRIYQPSDGVNYALVDLGTGDITFEGDGIYGVTHMDADGVIRVSISFTSLLPTADNILRVVHINENSSGDGTRTGANGRFIFSIAHPQTTTATINQPTIVDLDVAGNTSTFLLELDKIGVPQTLDRFIVTMTLDLHPQDILSPVVDSTVLTFGDLVITRDQINFRISLDGVTVFTSAILEGLNKLTLSYSPTTIIFKDLASPRQTISGSYAALPTTGVSFGPFGGYLRELALYAQNDTQQIVEYLNNG
jgi:hypothetical protein